MKGDLENKFRNVRSLTEDLCKPLSIEDYCIQGMDDVSPPKWHLAHTSWFFETFVFPKCYPDYKPYDPSFAYLFNSYYLGLDTPPYPRPQRGLLSRPTVGSIYEYRHYVNENLIQCLHSLPQEAQAELAKLVLLGLHHEQQHQELLLMDIKYNLSLQPDFPAYVKTTASMKTTAGNDGSPGITDYQAVQGSLAEIGCSAEDFCFDNESPRHQVFLENYCMANTLVTNGQFLAFIEEGGYQRPTLWLSDGWDWVLKEKVSAPLYWYYVDGQWMEFTLEGLQPLDLDQPVSHVSYYEASAFANWVQARLPTEQEWEYFVTSTAALGESQFLEDKIYQPSTAGRAGGPQQFLGYLWEWTSSAYGPYPGYKPLPGVLGEYNAKFMSNQMVLRGGSFGTAASHFRLSYRNFYQADKRWPFTGIRLVKEQKE